MGRSKASPWIAGTVVLSVIILVLAWFVAVSPALSSAGQARADAEQTRAQNVIQAQRLATLQQQFAELDTYRAELADIRTRIPSEHGLPDLLRELETRAGRAGVTVLSTAPGLPQEFYPAAPVEPIAPPPADTEGDEEGEETAEETEAAPPAPTGPVVIDGFVAVPLQVTVVGGYDDVASFVADIQAQMDRLYVITSFDITGQEEAEESGGRPATAEGDAEMVINGYVYVLDDRSVPAPDGADVEQPADDESDELITS